MMLRPIERESLLREKSSKIKSKLKRFKWQIISSKLSKPQLSLDKQRNQQQTPKRWL
jgi:hypothetical protein